MVQVSGIVTSSGGYTGTDFTASRVDTGVYEVQFTPGVFMETPSIVATPVTEAGYVCAISVYAVSVSGFMANVSNMAGSFEDYTFSFLATQV